MQTIQVKTNLHCGSCLKKLSPVLQASPQVQHWEVDMNSPDKTLTVKGDITTSQVKALVKQAGFEASATEAMPAVACNMPSAASQPQQGFWQNANIWKRSSFNTLNCLIGCSLGDFGMVIYLQHFHPHTPMWQQMLLATIAGLLTSILLETIILANREKMSWAKSLKTAASMSLISMVAMEIAMNTTDFMITGGKMAFSNPGYWLAFIPAAIAGFLVPLPYNYYQLKKHNKACH